MDKKISDLTALTSADPTDVLPIVDVSAGVTKKITKSALLNPAQKTITDADHPYTVLDTDYTILGDATGSNIDVMLPLAASCPGRIIVIKKIDSGGNNVSPTCSGSDFIDGSVALNIPNQYESYFLQSDGTTNWWKIAKYTP